MPRLKLFLAGVLGVLLVVGSSVPDAPVAGAERPLRFLSGAAGTLDPAFISDASDVQLLLQLYAGLTRLDERGTTYPSLAESWQVSADGLTYTFKLRSGLQFSDGSPLDATDVRRSWLRLLDPATGATAPDVLGLVDGASQRLAGEGSEDEVGINAPDPSTLVVRLRHPAAYFTAIVATPATFVVPRSADESSSWQSIDAFVGSGPYFVSGLDGDDLVLRANPEYVAGPPPIEEVRFVAGIEGDGVTAFAEDQADLVAVAGWDATWIAYDADLGPHLYRADALDVQYFGFDTTRPPFDDARVRRAFLLALDRQRLVELASGASSLAASSLVPPALWPDDFKSALSGDRAEARRLLDEAGYADRGDLGTIVVNNTAGFSGPAVAAWRDVLGVDIDVETMVYGDYLADLEAQAPDIFTISWIADYPSPHALYSLLLLPDALSNYGGWDDPEFVRLLEAAAGAEDDAARAEAYRTVDAYVDREAPVIPWSYDTSWWLVRDGLRGLGNLTIGLLDFGRVSWDG